MEKYLILEWEKNKNENKRTKKNPKEKKKKNEMSVEHLIVPESKEMLKKKDGGMPEADVKELLMAKTKTIHSTGS